MNNESLNKQKEPQNHGRTVSSDSGRGPNSFRTHIPGVVLSLYPSVGRMTTLVPFPDLNLIPHSQPYTTSDIYAEYDTLRERVFSALAEGDVELSGIKSNPLVIVDVLDQEAHQPIVVQPPPNSKGTQELRRITTLGCEDQKYHREILKRTRMIYDSLQLHVNAKEMRHPGVVRQRKPRGNIKASNLMKECGLWLNKDKIYVGSVPGVEIGDVFFYRMELCMVGLHRQFQAGIDYLSADRSPNGEPIATSIVVSGRYEDDEDRGEVLVYSGHGGQDRSHRQCQHQKLEGGNLAMERSMHYGFEVRVIRSFKCDNNVSMKVFVYDGLYKIVEYNLDIGKSGFGVFKFKLVRVQGQPEMGSARMKLARSLRSIPLDVNPDGYIRFDISEKKEKVPVYLYNDIDFDQSPVKYDYIVKSAISCAITAGGETSHGCNCNYSCTDDCICVRKNGGELPYDTNGNLLRGKPIIFECGVLCKCGIGCKNRVAQRGLRNRMEVFRSKETGWAVRTLDLIQAGEFISEYAGVVLTKEQAHIVSMNGDVLVYPERFVEKWRLWGNISTVYPDYVQPDYPSLSQIDYAIDVSKMRNVASYICHSKEPNVMAQFVLHDHDNLKFPRVMLFALENISPLTELRLDYGFIDEMGENLAICN